MGHSDPNNNEFIDHLSPVAVEDVTGLTEAQKHYGNSWKQRGGVGAFMMLARKWDRIEQKAKQANASVNQYDIFEHLAIDDRGEGLIDDIRDLRRYLMLVEAEARAMGVGAARETHRDNRQKEEIEALRRKIAEADREEKEPNAGAVSRDPISNIRVCPVCRKGIGHWLSKDEGPCPTNGNCVSDPVGASEIRREGGQREFGGQDTQQGNRPGPGYDYATNGSAELGRE